MAKDTALDVGDLDEFCRASLAGYKIPKRYETVEVLPRNAGGKVVKRTLQDRFTTS